MAHTHRSLALLAKNVPTSLIQVNGHRHVFHLAPAIGLHVRKEAGRHVVEYSPLNIFVFDEDEERAYRAFAEMFEALWEQIAEAPDSELTGDARELKDRFRGLVGRLTRAD